MANLRRVFSNGAMNKDIESRLMNDGDYRHAENMIVLDTEDSDSGTAQNMPSNRQLTNFDYGDTTEPRTICAYADDFEDKIYSFIKSDNGCYLWEWDNKNQVLAVLLADTRTSDRVFALDENFLITGVFKILNEDSNENLFGWTDDNMQPCCINIARAKTWATNGFTIEDIYLIKKPPRYAPVLTALYQDQKTNNMEEKFLSFSSRYKYRDGEYSALSDYTNYFFYPKDFKLDYYTMDNLGMVNSFNAVRIDFNTGEPQVIEVQLVVKESNSNNLYIIETFNLLNEGWSANQTKSFIFSNNKLYTLLPSKEIYRSFDNVPLKAKALTLIGNRPMFANYLEGRDLVDLNGNEIFVDFSLALINQDIDGGVPFAISISTNTMEVTNPDGALLTAGSKIDFYFEINILGGAASYKNNFFFILGVDYATLEDVFASDEFINFLTIVDNDFRNSYQYDEPPGTAYEVDIYPTISYALILGVPTFTVTPVTFHDTLDGDSIHIVDFEFVENSYLSIAESANSTSLKTNRDYEVGIVYEDNFNRRTTVLTSQHNTIFIPQRYSIYRNRIKVYINNLPPAWADRYKIVVKAKPLQYQTIYVNKFYNDDAYVWAKLEAENKDKVKIGDTLIVKKAADEVVVNPVKVKVLALETKVKVNSEGWIDGNVDQNGNVVVEEPGYYMKLRPDGFSMDYTDYKVYQSTTSNRSIANYPVIFLDLFDNVAPGPVITPLAIPSGSSITLYWNSTRHYNSGWADSGYSKLFYAQRDYDSLEEFLNEVVLNKPMVSNEGDTIQDYETLTSIVTGSDLKKKLRVQGAFQGGTGRYGRINGVIIVRTSTGYYVFETDPKQGESEIFYETEQTFDIFEGNHLARKQDDAPNLQDQNAGSFIPAIIDLDFFNCYTQGNGVESYKVKDAFNTNYLNIDSRPSATSLEKYKSVRRQATMTYGEPYVEDSNINGINEFNLSTVNWKDLDKQYGSIQALVSRDNDIAVFQEEKASKVRFEKRSLKNADGTDNVVTSDDVLGDQITYLGENGIGKNPESIAINDFQIFYTNSRRGIVQRLSIDGVTDIVNGMVDYFRDLFITKPQAKKLGVYDPYYNHYIISVGQEQQRVYEVACGNFINKSRQSLPFTYNFTLNNLSGDVSLVYNIEGFATITALFDGNVYAASNVTESGDLTFTRTSFFETVVQVTVTPITLDISYTISNLCPVGAELSLTSIVLNDELDSGKTIINRFRWGTSGFYSDNDVFGAGPIQKFITETGIEGIGKFPASGAVVNIQSYKDVSNTGRLLVDQCNRIGYLVTTDVYTSADLATLLPLVNWLTITSVQNSLISFTETANFLFNRATGENLYLIWDYIDRKIYLLNYAIDIETGDTTNINIVHDFIIIDGPVNGTANIIGQSIEYTHDGGLSTVDSFVYQVGDADCTTQATITINIITP